MKPDEETTVEALREPPMYRLVYLDDDSTSYEFVVHTIIHYVGHNEVTAHDIATQIHMRGEAIAAVFPFEIAEQVASDIVKLARTNNYPLKLRIDPDEA